MAYHISKLSNTYKNKYELPFILTHVCQDESKPILHTLYFNTIYMLLIPFFNASYFFLTKDKSEKGINVKVIKL